MRSMYTEYTKMEDEYIILIIGIAVALFCICWGSICSICKRKTVKNDTSFVVNNQLLNMALRGNDFRNVSNIPSVSGQIMTPPPSEDKPPAYDSPPSYIDVAPPSYTDIMKKDSFSDRF